MAGVWITVQRTRSGEPVAFGCTRYADVASKLIFLVRFAFADEAFDVRLVETVAFSFIAALLCVDPVRQLKFAFQLFIWCACA